MPVDPFADESDGHKYQVTSSFENITAEWMRISIPDLDDLDYLYYAQMRRDAFISKLSGTEEGRKYLENAWRLSQTEPDREASRRAFGRRSVCGND